MKMNEKFEIVVPNVAFAWGTKLHMSDLEFMVYAHLQFMKQAVLWNETYTCADLIMAGLGYKKSNWSRDRIKIVLALNGLVEKGYMTIECDGNIGKEAFKAGQVQEILDEKITVVEIEEGGKKKTFKGFTKITGADYNFANNEGRALMVIAYIAWRSGINYNVAKSEWAKVLNCTVATVETSFKKYEKTFLHIIQGETYENEQGQVRQETNVHVVAEKKAPSLEEKEAKLKSESYLDKKFSKVTDEKFMADGDIYHQIFDKFTKLTQKGYNAWKETECPVVREAGQKKIDAMKKSTVKEGYAGKLVAKFEEEYQDNKRRKEAAQRATEHHAETYVEYEPPVKVAKPKESKGDFTEFLGGDDEDEDEEDNPFRI